MTEKTDGGPAFPRWEWQSYGGGSGRHILEGGMSLRDWYAGQALSGLLASMASTEMSIAIGIVSNQNGQNRGEALALTCYDMADAMLAARAPEQDGET